MEPFLLGGGGVPMVPGRACGQKPARYLSFDVRVFLNDPHSSSYPQLSIHSDAQILADRKLQRFLLGIICNEVGVLVFKKEGSNRRQHNCAG
jgi:hypothetical protein